MQPILPVTTAWWCNRNDVTRLAFADLSGEFRLLQLYGAGRRPQQSSPSGTSTMVKLGIMASRRRGGAVMRWACARWQASW